MARVVPASNLHLKLSRSASGLDAAGWASELRDNSLSIRFSDSQLLCLSVMSDANSHGVQLFLENFGKNIEATLQFTVKAVLNVIGDHGQHPHK